MNFSLRAGVIDRPALQNPHWTAISFSPSSEGIDVVVIPQASLSAVTSSHSSSASIVVELARPKLALGTQDWGDHIFFTSSQATAEEISEVLRLASERSRRLQRLAALKKHRLSGWNRQQDPTLDLINSFVSDCSLAQTFPELLNSLGVVRSIIPFDAAVLFSAHNTQSYQMHWRAEKNRASAGFSLHLANFPSIGNSLTPFLPTGITTNHPLAGVVSGIIQSPWGAACAVAIPANGQDFVLILVRQEIVPFSEQDLATLELVVGPWRSALARLCSLEKIEYSSREWRSTFDAISEPLLVIDSSYRVLKANKAFAEAVAVDIKRIKDKKCFTQFSGKRRPCEGCPITTNSGQHHLVTKKDGGRFYAWTYTVNVLGQKTHFQFYRSAAKEYHLRSALIQSEKMAALGNLVGAIAHEINNPLGGILAIAQVTLRSMDKADPQRPDWQEIEMATVRAKGIVELLLGFSGSKEERVFEVDLQETLYSVLLLAKLAIRNVAVETNVDIAGRVALLGPPSALQQVLFNLITNAAHAMGGMGRIGLSAKADCHGIEIRIQDSGPGLVTRNLETIFDPFQSSKAEGEGTGLGLSIVRSLTQKLQGRVSVEQTSSLGTTFLLELPLAAGTK